MLSLLFLWSFLSPTSLLAAERQTIRLNLSGPNLVLRKPNKTGQLEPIQTNLSNAVIEVSVPKELLTEDPTTMDVRDLLSAWKKSYPADFQAQAGFTYQPLKVITNASGVPREENLFASLEFQARRNGAKVRILAQNTRINNNPSCAWIEEQIPNHAPIHQLATSEGQAQCTICKFLPTTTTLSNFSDLVIDKINQHFVLPPACVAASMTNGTAIVKSRFQRCDNNNSSRKAMRPTCVTPELMDYNNNIISSTALCFGLNPKHLIPMIHHESRMFSNIQAAGGDTGFTQLTGPFVLEMHRLYGDDLKDLDLISGTKNKICNEIKQEYEQNLPLITGQKSQRCSWMNPVTNLVLASAHFRDVFLEQKKVIDTFAPEAFSASTKDAILAMVATHSHHIPISKIRLRRFLNSAEFKKIEKSYKGRGEKIPLDVFTAKYKEGFSGNAGTYFRSVLKDYNELTKHQAGCGW
jgi:hypothetical protein